VSKTPQGASQSAGSAGVASSSSRPGIFIVFAQGDDGIFHMAEDLLQVGVSIKDRPPGTGTRQEVLAQYGLIPKA
jgi:hypothetical protein